MSDWLSRLMDETATELVHVGQDTADRYRLTARGLGDRLSRQELKTYSRLCTTIAASGWRSFEPVNLLLDIANLPVAERLLDIARYGEYLSGYSIEPVSRYFETVIVLHEAGLADQLPLIEMTGQRIKSRQPSATTLLSQYFELAGQVTLSAGPESVAWLETTEQFLEADRDVMTRFFRISRSAQDESDDISWPMVRRFTQQSAEKSLAYLARANALFEKLPGRLCAHYEELLLAHEDDLLPELADTMLSLPGAPEVLEVLLQLAREIDDTRVLVACLANCRELPLDRAGVVLAWLRHGMAITRGNTAAGVAYVRLESLESVRVLHDLRGQVNFSEHRRTFGLLAEALASHQIEVVSVEEEGDLRELSGLPQSDGRQVYLPARVNLFDERDDNFGFYKVSLFHQLGYAEFGCFDAIETIRLALNEYADKRLAERVFMIAEDARIDWQLARRYPGLAPKISKQKARSVRARREQTLLTSLSRWLEAMVLASLDAAGPPELDDTGTALVRSVAALDRPDTGVEDSLEVTRRCMALIASGRSCASSGGASRQDVMATLEELPPPIDYRGELDVEQVESSRRLEVIIEELQDEVPDDQPGSEQEIAMPGAEQDQVEIGDLRKGDVQAGAAVLMSELDQQPDPRNSLMEPENREHLPEIMAGVGGRLREAARHKYDEWDYHIGDYRPAWCTLYEHTSLDEDPRYVERTLAEHQALSGRIRSELNKVRPEMLRKVRGVAEGEDLDLERSIAYIVDRRAGLTPEENIYVQRQRRERDVSTLFLLDMSASTDDLIPDPDAPSLEAPDVDDEEYLMRYFQQRRDYEASARRIIDLEKQSVILMADALETLGDAYSVCGFSGYGRDQVDYFLCKDFDEGFTARAKGRIGGIKPARSTRMGPPIRHGTRRLMETGSRIKALIIISDGYPQDHDYGTDRNSRDYGLMDTMKALGEARQQGVLTYCLTVDPSGHDYLRAMSPDSQYMVIQDIEQLPEELSRVYRSLTG